MFGCLWFTLDLGKEFSMKNEGHSILEQRMWLRDLQFSSRLLLISYLVILFFD